MHNPVKIFFAPSQKGWCIPQLQTKAGYHFSIKMLVMVFIFLLDQFLSYWPLGSKI